MSNVTVQEALKKLHDGLKKVNREHDVEHLILQFTEIKAALSELDNSEPVGYLCESPDKVARIFVDKPLAIHSHTNTPLYTSPQPIEKCEPYAWIVSDGFSKTLVTDKEHLKTAQRFNWEIIPLYTSPQPKEWVGLSSDDIAEGQKNSWVDKQAFESVAWWADEKLKQLNTKG